MTGHLGEYVIAAVLAAAALAGGKPAEDSATRRFPRVIDAVEARHSGRIMSPGPDIVRDDDGSIMVMFGGETQAAALVAAFAEIPPDAWVAGIATTWFNEQEDCEGQDFPDDDHCLPVACKALLPAELPARAGS